MREGEVKVVGGGGGKSWKTRHVYVLLCRQELQARVQHIYNFTISGRCEHNDG